MRETPAVELIKILETESDLLIAGELKELATLLSRKTNLEKKLRDNPCSADEAKHIKKAADINARLFQAAINGLKSANRRLTEVAKVQSELSLYTENGEKTVVRKSGEAMERKA